LRIFACHADDAGHKETDAVSSLRDREDSLGMNDLDYYRGFEEKVQGVKRALLSTLIEIREAGKTVAAYGAAAKGNTLLNYCGIRTDFVEFAVDRSPHKQGKYLPGTRIPVLDPRAIEERRPDYILILPWNLKNEIMKQTEFVREWGGKFIVPIPEVQIT